MSDVNLGVLEFCFKQDFFKKTDFGGVFTVLKHGSSSKLITVVVVTETTTELLQNSFCTSHMKTQTFQII
jgi:hypothetical protein